MPQDNTELDPVFGSRDVFTTRDRRGFVPFSPTTGWRLMRDGKFPKPIEISPGLNGWRRSTLEQWLETRKERTY